MVFQRTSQYKLINESDSALIDDTEICEIVIAYVHMNFDSSHFHILVLSYQETIQTNNPSVPWNSGQYEAPHCFCISRHTPMAITNHNSTYERLNFPGQPRPSSTTNNGSSAVTSCWLSEKSVPLIHNVPQAQRKWKGQGEVHREIAHYFWICC